MGRGFGGKGGMGGLGDMAKLAKMAQKMQDDMVAAQRAMEDARIEATSGGGVVKAVVNGKGRIIAVEIKPEAVDPDDVEMLQDLIVSAVSEAQEQAEAAQTAHMQGLAGGMDLPPGLF
ncbi:MAG TPA: YbaB/EbfC family nucleoid-associated protein [Chthonomonadales bacterium]|nr:YbaB/EbfC family nucleoid-associated protein [Chthonomonadales bacterium]